MLGNRTMRWTAATAVLCLVLLAAAWLLLVSPRRAEATDLHERDLSAQQQNEQLEVRIEQLKAQSAQLPAYRAELAGVIEQLPPTADMARLVREVTVLATVAGATLDAVTPSGATLLSGTGSPGAGLSGTGSSGTGAQAAASAGTATSSSVAQIPITIVAHGDYFQAVAFLQKLQTQLNRALLVTGVQVGQYTSGGTSTGSGMIKLTITGAVFAWPGGAQVTPTTSPTASPTGTATGTATGSGIPSAPAIPPTTMPATVAPTSPVSAFPAYPSATIGPTATTGGTP
jgi:Tfp pilus assembly protein PilO